MKYTKFAGALPALLHFSSVACDAAPTFRGGVISGHKTLDADENVQKEMQNVAHAVVHAVRELRVGRLSQPDAGLQRPRPK